MMPDCKYVAMNQKTLDSGKWKNDEFLFTLLKFIAPNQFPVMVSDYIEDGEILFFEPNEPLQDLLKVRRGHMRPYLDTWIHL